MKRVVLGLGLSLSLFLVGCGTQPNIEVDENNDTNQTRPVQNEVNASVVETNTTTQTTPTVISDQPLEENVSRDNLSVTDETVDVNETTPVNNTPVHIDLSNYKVYFDFDKFYIRSDMLPVLNKIADFIVEDGANSNFTIRIEGNCDEWGSDEYNYALGLKRAKSVKDYLISKGVPVEKLTIISYGESNPVCLEHNKVCWQKNRRVEFTLLP